jgi:UDP-N-acetylglucosamine diphosphorylase / glucose-1-phosphate thymidylyltransferase / UDP-N-acetylgalactosamine diphosphorylase / glucosamine-1-phosphate N-acetyltransferase / galactosamine-1-phosphate N-acetyltransferase
MGHISPDLAGFDEPCSPPVVEGDAVDTATARLYLSARFVPDWSPRFDLPRHEAMLVARGEPVGWSSPAGSPGPAAAFFADPAAGAPPAAPRIEISGRVLTGFWQLVTEHGAQLATDMQRLVGTIESPIPAGVTLLGGAGGGLRSGERVAFEPGVVIDCTAGAVWIEDDVRVRAFTRIAGPARIGRGTTLLGGSFDCVSVGPRCKLRGELESSVVLGYSNKAHDGFIGHSVIGRWVNLGALTTNSDLKNNYGAVRVGTPSGEVDTGEMKVGCFIGDHVRTAIGTMLNTGTVVGPGSNIFGATMPPRHVLPFSWGGGGVVHALERFIETTEVAMGRRDVMLTPGVRAVLERAWRASRGQAE